jgi:hypothetical protein
MYFIYTLYINIHRLKIYSKKKSENFCNLFQKIFALKKKDICTQSDHAHVHEGVKDRVKKKLDNKIDI